jgi:hypothetical protein
MWAIANSTDFPAVGSWVQDRDANKIWLVCVKATFDVAPDGRVRPSPDQPPPLLQGVPLDGDFTKSLVYESDFFGLKPCTDVLVNGSAWAPGGRPATSVDIGFIAGPIRKRLKVFGDRWWTVSLAGTDVISEPELFISRPVRYEQAFGGWDRSSADAKDHRLDARNPVGQGFITNPNGRLGRPLPAIEHPGDLVTAWHSRPEPAGLNAVACHWSPRRELAGTYDEAWLKSRFPLWAEDLDPRYYCCAPRDQQVDGYLRGGEPVQVVNMSPNGPIRFDLPRLVFGFSTRLRREIVHHRGSLATVILEPEGPRVIMVWQSALMCNHHADDLDQTTVRLKKLV